MPNRRLVVTKFGGPDVLQVVEDATLPEPATGEVRIRIEAASAAFTDTIIRRGWYPDVKDKPPFTIGYDMVGVVDEVGENSTCFTAGDRVAGMPVIGACAQYICLPEDKLVPVPEDLPAEVAVSMILSYVTAYQMLHRFTDVQDGQSVLIQAAGGAVGTALLQLGKLKDLQMFGTASSRKHDLVKELGGVPIDYKTEDFAKRVMELTDGQGVHGVFETVDIESARRSFGLLQSGGTSVIYGGVGLKLESVWGGISLVAQIIRLLFVNMFACDRKMKFYSIGAERKKHPEWFEEDLKTLFEMARKGFLEPVIAKIASIDDAKEVHEMIERGDAAGKIVFKF